MRSSSIPNFPGTCLWEKARGTVEQKFHFDPNQTIEARDINAMEQELNQMRADTIRALTGGRQTLLQILSRWEVERATVTEQLRESTKRLAQAEIDRNALRRW